MNVTIETAPADELNAPALPEHLEQPTTAFSIGGLLDAEDAQDADGLDDISNGGEIRFEPFAITKANGQKTRVFVKELDPLALVDIEAGRLLVKGKEVMRAPAFEAKRGMCLELVAAIHKRTKAGEFAPMFADVDAVQEWMKRPNNKALVSQMLAGIYIVNPEMSPQKKMATVKSLS